LLSTAAGVELAVERIRGGSGKARPAEDETQLTASKRAKPAIARSPDIGITPDAQLPDIRSLIYDFKEAVDRNLRLDKGITKADNFTYISEDGRNHLVVPSNVRELMKVDGWKSVLSLFIKLGVSMKTSDTPFENANASNELDSFIAGLANRLRFIAESSDELKLKPSATDPITRGRAYVDLLIIKSFTLEVNIEKFLPASVQVQGRSALKYYLAGIAGARGIQSLKSIPDLINTLIKEVVRKQNEKCIRSTQSVLIPYADVVDDYIHKRSVSVTVNGKKAVKLQPIGYNRISKTCFTLYDWEDDLLKERERPFDELFALAERYSNGVPISELKTVRGAFEKAYRAKVSFVQQHSAWKSRRMEAYKLLASFSTDKKSMESFRLSEKSKRDALDNLPMIIQEAHRSKDYDDLKKILANLSPRQIPGAKLDPTNAWNLINASSIMRSVGLISYHDPQEEGMARDIYRILLEITPEITSIASEHAKPVPKKARNPHKTRKQSTPEGSMTDSG
jgi:hypothetical protein